MSTTSLRELSSLPSLRNHWVAVDPRGIGPQNDRHTPLRVSLRSGAIIVDADPDLDVLCARLRAAKETSLTIVFAGNQRS